MAKRKYPEQRWYIYEEILSDKSKVYGVRNVKANVTINAVNEAAALRIAAVLEKDSVD